MNQSNAKLVDQYATGGERLSDSIRGWSQGDLRRTPPPSADPELGKWSVHQIIIHLEDAELAFSDRLRRVIAMDEPALLNWDENTFAQRLHYVDQSAVDAIELIRLTRRQLGRVLKKLTDADFERIGIHNERGPQKLSAIIGFADWHLNHHLEFVEKKRLAFNI
jgi:DinB superfamily